MAEVLLTSETFIKNISPISDNISGKYILASMREAQEVHLKNIIGEVLLDKLKRLVSDKQIDAEGNAMYKTLIDKCQYFLAYTAIVELAYKVTYKIGNAGVVKSSDENMEVASQDEIITQKEYYQGKADYFCMEIQNYILEHRSEYPEVDDNHCHRIHSNLYSAATCGIFLGGARGKSRRR